MTCVATCTYVDVKIKFLKCVDAFLPMHIYMQEGSWSVEKVIDVPSKKVEGWALPEMPGIQVCYIELKELFSHCFALPSSKL